MGKKEIIKPLVEFITKDAKDMPLYLKKVQSMLKYPVAEGFKLSGIMHDGKNYIPYFVNKEGRKLIRSKEAYNTVLHSKFMESLSNTAHTKAKTRNIIKEIRKPYKKSVDAFTKKTGVNWSDETGYLQGMDDTFRTEKFLNRYYQNVLEKAMPLTEQLIKNGELVRVKGLGWLGLIDNKMVPVTPEHYVVSRMEAFKNIGGTYAGKGQIYYRGTPLLKAKNHYYDGVEMPHELWAANDGSVASLYANGTGRTSIPLVINSKWTVHPATTEIINPSSNVFWRGGDGSIMSYYRNNAAGFNMMKVPRVKDDQWIGKTIEPYTEEIVVSRTAPNIKSWYNTLDFTEGAAPMFKNGSKLTLVPKRRRR